MIPEATPAPLTPHPRTIQHARAKSNFLSVLTKAKKELAGLVLAGAAVLGSGERANASVITGDFSSFSNVMAISNLGVSVFGVNNSYGNFTVNKSPATTTAHLAFINNLGEPCGYADSQNSTKNGTSELLGSYSSPSIEGHFGLLSGIKPSSIIAGFDTDGDGKIGSYVFDTTTHHLDLTLDSGDTWAYVNQFSINNGSLGDLSTLPAYGVSSDLGKVDVTIPENPTRDLFAAGLVGLALAGASRKYLSSVTRSATVPVKK